MRLMGKKNRENAKLCTIIEFVGRELIEQGGPKIGEPIKG